MGFEYPSWNETSNLAGTKVELQFPEKCTHGETRELLHKFAIGWGIKVDLAMEKNRREYLVKKTSDESFVNTIQNRLQSKVHCVEKFAGVVRDPPA